ncbi:MAG: hypothetical protein LUI06_04165 [Ruminococcus sp.]|nr:hypothetical protein [Ruminococcus sp.]
MRFLRTLSATAVSAILAGTVAISACATSYEDVVTAAEEAGVPANNVQELSNFLEANADSFTSDDFDHMIEVVTEVSETYVVELAQELFGKTPGELTEDEKTQLGKYFTTEDREAIIQALLDLGDEYGVEIDVDAISQGEYSVAASIESDSDDDDSSSASSSSSSGTTAQIVVEDAVAATGASAETEVPAETVAIAGIALMLAVTGVVVVARKNKE